MEEWKIFFFLPLRSTFNKEQSDLHIKFFNKYEN